MPMHATSPVRPHLHIGVTGHRRNHPSLRHPESLASLRVSLASIVGTIAEATVSGGEAVTRLFSMLADGTDQDLAAAAGERGWKIVMPAPFGLALTAALGTGDIGTVDVKDAALALAAGNTPDSPLLTESQRMQIADLLAAAQNASVFALADADAEIEALWTESLRDPQRKTKPFMDAISRRYALASRIIVEQSDLLVAVWDGTARTAAGGTGHTITVALESRVPVVLVDPASPSGWVVVQDTRELDLTLTSGAFRTQAAGRRQARIAEIVHQALSGEAKVEPPNAGHSPDIASGYGAFLHETGARLLDYPFTTYDQVVGILPQGAPAATPAPAAEPLQTYLDRVATTVTPVFEGIDRISTRLGKAYRGGMVLNFLLALTAVFFAALYLPFGSEVKAVFTSVEFVLLLSIVLLTRVGVRRKWHTRWLSSRRAAEHLRHNAQLLPLGVSRPFSLWPRGEEVWPEWHALQVLRATGLPRLTLSQEMIRDALNRLAAYIDEQVSYHERKAALLERAHERLDKASLWSFRSAMLIAALYIVLHLASVHNETMSKAFTVLAVTLPMAGATFAGVRWFGELERFAGLSRTTLAALKVVRVEIAARLDAGKTAPLSYEAASDLARRSERALVAELEGWRSLFAEKYFALPS